MILQVAVIGVVVIVVVGEGRRVGLI